ncbi:MAG: M28 family peptidase [Treponema sp.]|nr:M28 family peptidase [Treponema sp.]
MSDTYFKGMPWQYFKEFISPEANRYLIIKKLLQEAALSYDILEIAGNRHFYITPPSGTAKNNVSNQPPIILTAHYDRTEGSPGANDNSAGVFLLIETAIKLKAGKVKNWIIIFTDREELKSGESIQVQGSFTLAAGLKKMGMGSARLFCFDACGTGDTLVISTTADYIVKKEKNNLKLRESISELRKMALDTARNLGMVKALLAPTPFSDDVGFLMAGFAAQTITVLPSAECINLVSELRKNPDYANALISAEIQKDAKTKPIPETWRYLNSPSDSHLRLTPENYRSIIRFADALCRG